MCQSQQPNGLVRVPWDQGTSFWLKNNVLKRKESPNMSLRWTFLKRRPWTLHLLLHRFLKLTTLMQSIIPQILNLISPTEAISEKISLIEDEVGASGVVVGAVVAVATLNAKCVTVLDTTPHIAIISSTPPMVLHNLRHTQVTSISTFSPLVLLYLLGHQQHHLKFLRLTSPTPTLHQWIWQQLILSQLCLQNQVFLLPKSLGECISRQRPRFARLIH